MAGLRAFLAVASLSLFAAVSPGEAQTPAAENIQIGLSTDHVSITAGFSGADLTIFGSLENADPLVARQG
ncbi:MAG: TIGR02186 family protein, partial [Mesorhizobium sp.]